MPTIQAVVSDDLHATLERLAQARGLSVSALTRDILHSSISRTGTFFGVVMCRSNADADSDEWFALAMDGDDADVSGGALIIRNAAGLAHTIVAPGRWRECSLRIDRDRAIFHPADNLEAPKRRVRERQ